MEISNDKFKDLDKVSESILKKIEQLEDTLTANFQLKYGQCKFTIDKKLLNINKEMSLDTIQLINRGKGVHKITSTANMIDYSNVKRSLDKFYKMGKVSLVSKKSLMIGWDHGKYLLDLGNKNWFQQPNKQLLKHQFDVLLDETYFRIDIRQTGSKKIMKESEV